ncbi:MAG TPA: pilus assembly PilX N-terminal domain-containing protein [Candidatus Methylomirabilis sp.]|nr:pilus assembly PilX N-terminal domain-containing protein [Candidatus Methylomirabilis sp.]HSC69928.1 pilus assembly PilX N-terminal domain-containing protein [Candidatus Methylomirabilis sp.]
MCASGTGRNSRGAALVIVMLVMAVLLLAGTTFMTISSTESQIALNQRVSAQASLLAEAAIHKAVAQLNANPSYTGESNTTLGGGTFTVTVTTAATQPCGGTSAKDLIAEASVPVGGGQARVQIRTTVDKISYPYRWAAFAAVPNTVVTSLNPIFGENRTQKELWLKDNSATDAFDSSHGPYDGAANSGAGGNVGGNGDMTLDSGVQVKGSARAGDAIYKGSGVTISGGQAESLSPTFTSPGEPFPSVTPPTAPTTSLIVSTGAHNLEATGSPYVYTSMNFSDGTSLTTSGGPVTIYVTNAVTLGDNVTFGAHPDTQLRVILKSDGTSWSDTASFTAGQNFRLYGSLFGKYTDIKLNDGAQVYGSMIGRTVVLHEDSKVHYDQAMQNQEICHSGKFSIRRGTWREVIP